MPKDKVRHPSHKDKYANLAADKPVYHSDSAVLPPVQNAKKKPKPRPQQPQRPEEPHPNVE